MKYLILLGSLLYSVPGQSEVLYVQATGSYDLPNGVCQTSVKYRYESVDDGSAGAMFRRAVTVCYNKYGPRSPCLVKLEQVGPNDYQATCGAKQ